MNGLSLTVVALLVLLPVLLAGAAQAAEGAKTAPEDWPQCLLAHPRLLLTPERLQQVRAKLAHPEAQEVFNLIKAEGDLALAQPPVERKMVGRRLLFASREVERRCVIWAFLAVLMDDAKYADAAVREMRNAVAYTDWNPSHFLDVAEMCAGIGLAYDWLYEKMTAEDRAVIRAGLLKLGLRPALATNGHFGTNNHSPVCHAGLAVAALAIAEDEPAISRQIVERAINNVRDVEPCYAPDGVYAEGPSYWIYGSDFYAVLCDALLTALGSTYGLEKMPGLLESVQYMEHVTTPTGGFYQYADCLANRAPSFGFFWLAARSATPELAAREWDRLLADVRKRLPATKRKNYQPMDALNPLYLIWGAPPVDRKITLPLCWWGRGLTPVAFARTGWDRGAAYLAIKGGRARTVHGHMDAGSFIYEWGGVRWAIDPGMENYTNIEARGLDLWNMSQGSQRWEIFRLGPESHNILRFDEGQPQVEGQATLVEVEAGPPFRAVIDLQPPYAYAVESARRTARLFPDGHAELEDRWVLKHFTETVAWQLLTGASVQIEENRCVLESGGKRLALEVLEPAGVRIECRPVSELMQDYDRPNPGVSRIRVLVKADMEREQVLRIALRPVIGGGN